MTTNTISTSDVELIRNPMPAWPTGVRRLIDGAEITGPDCERLRTEVTGYITAYWQQACDGHPYYAF